MKRFVPLVLLVVFVAVSCGKKTEEPKTEIRVAKPNEEMRKPDPAGFVDMHFLDEQASNRSAVRKQIDSLRAQPVIDRAKITAIVNKRKGEIITLKRDLRASTSLTPAQRDSLIAPLEQESYELSDDLIAVAK
jgi:hypothetical protein